MGRSVTCRDPIRDAFPLARAQDSHSHDRTRKIRASTPEGRDMRQLLRLLGSLGAASLLLVGAGAHAQATRTWVSGVGDDANPCSRTAPCKTFAGAISKTAAGGEISVLDPGGFGGVTITKSISITNDGVGESGVLVSGTNGIVV